MTPYYQEDGITILEGDCREILPTLPDQSVNCCVTSPPYWGLRDYGTVTWEGGEASCSHKNSHSVQGQTGQRADRSFTGSQNFYRDVCAKCGARRTDNQLGLEPTPEEYVSRTVEVFREVRRVLRPDGTLWLNMGDSYATGAGAVGECPGGGEQGERWKGNRGTHTAKNSGEHGPSLEAMGPRTQPNRMPLEGLKPKDLIGIPWRVAFALQADGWYLRSDIIWHKPNPMPESVTDRPTKSHEYLFLLSKSERYFYDHEAIKEPQAPGTFERFGANGKRTGAGPKQLSSPNGLIRDRATYANAILDGGRNKRSVWTVPTEAYPEAHFATFPTALIEPCIKAGCPAGGTVFDPFGGSGTTMQVARALGCRSLMIELNRDYCRLAAKRLRQRVLPLAESSTESRPPVTQETKELFEGDPAA